MKEYYNLKELLEDPDFRKYMEQPDSPEGRKWAVWLNYHPHLQPTALEAIMKLKKLGFGRSQLSQTELAEAWQQMEQRIRQGNQNHPNLYYYRIAASLALLLLLAAAWWWLPFFHRQVIKTAYGETRDLLLEDGTIVLLNANSTLTYDSRSLHTTERVVCLEGEAFFDVSETATNGQPSSFSVVSEAGGVVEVLGTSFNVLSRRHITQVVLEKGKVNFKADDQQTLLLPGEMAEYSGISKKLFKKKVKAEHYTAWKDHQFVFDDTPLHELAQILEDRYGLQVVFRDKTLSEKKISGTITARRADQILTAVERIFGIQAIIRRDTVFISSYNP